MDVHIIVMDSVVLSCTRGDDRVDVGWCERKVKRASVYTGFGN